LKGKGESARDVVPKRSVESTPQEIPKRGGVVKPILSKVLEGVAAEEANFESHRREGN